MYVHRRAQEEEGNAAAVMLPMEKVLQLKAVKVVSRTIISPSSPKSGLRLPKIPADNRAKIPAAKSLLRAGDDLDLHLPAAAHPRGVVRT